MSSSGSGSSSRGGSIPFDSKGSNLPVRGEFTAFLDPESKEDFGDRNHCGWDILQNQFAVLTNSVTKKFYLLNRAARRLDFINIQNRLPANLIITHGFPVANGSLYGFFLGDKSNKKGEDKIVGMFVFNPANPEASSQPIMFPKQVVNANARIEQIDIHPHYANYFFILARIHYPGALAQATDPVRIFIINAKDPRFFSEITVGSSEHIMHMGIRYNDLLLIKVKPEDNKRQDILVKYTLNAPLEEILRFETELPIRKTDKFNETQFQLSANYQGYFLYSGQIYCVMPRSIEPAYLYSDNTLNITHWAYDGSLIAGSNLETYPASSTIYQVQLLNGGHVVPLEGGVSHSDLYSCCLLNFKLHPTLNSVTCTSIDLPNPAPQMNNQLGKLQEFLDPYLLRDIQGLVGAYLGPGGLDPGPSPQNQICRFNLKTIDQQLLNERKIEIVELDKLYKAQKKLIFRPSQNDILLQKEKIDLIERNRQAIAVFQLILSEYQSDFPLALRKILASPYGAAIASMADKIEPILPAEVRSNFRDKIAAFNNTRLQIEVLSSDSTSSSSVKPTKTGK